MTMDYQFSFLWFGVGIAIIIIGVLFLKNYKWVADNLGSGVASYDRYKIVALVVVGAGFVIMTNLAPFILDFIGNAIFGGMKG